MPYSGQDDPNLPPDIKKLPTDKRRQFVAVWNSAYKNCMSGRVGGGAGSRSNCEGIAFRFARSAVKELIMEEEETKEGRVISSANLKKLQDAFAAIQEVLSAGELKVEEKSMAELPPAAYVQEQPRRFDGATSWRDYDSWKNVSDVTGQASDLWWAFDGLTTNIRMDEKMTDAQKASSMMAALQELSVRLGDVKPKEKGLLQRAKEMLFGETEEEEEGEKAEWDTKYINDLPDSAFAYISSGGEKDEDGKTVPRALRHLPYKNSNGEIDLPHLRNALARLPQSSLSPEEKAKAGAVLRKAAETKKVGEFSKKEEELAVGSKPYPNEHAARVRDPGDFEPNSFRSMELPKSGGVRIIIGHLKGQTTTTTQAYRFPVDSFTAEEAKTWLKEHDVKGARFEPAKKAKKDLVGSFKVSKGADGSWRWISLTTNRYKDREGEIFSEEAHKEYVEYATTFKHYPELWLWHTPGSRVGIADFVDYTDGFVVHSGTFDKGKEAVAASLAAAKDLAVSHGYKYRATDKEDGVYDWYRTFEVSSLPAARAANAWTEILAQKEVVMSFSEDKKAFLTKHLGEEAVAEIESNVAALSKQLEEAGVEFKDLLDDTPAEEESEEQEKPADETEGEKPAEISEQFSQVIEKLDALDARVEQIESGFKSRLDALERSDAEKVDDAVAPRRPAPGKVEGPANSDSTQVNAEEQKALEEKTKQDPIKPYVDDLVGGRLVGGGVVTQGD